MHQLLALACAVKVSRTCTEISKILKVSTASVTGIKDSLVKSGYYGEVVDKDRRVSRFQTTTEGVNALNDVIATLSKIQEVQEDATTTLSE